MNSLPLIVGKYLKKYSIKGWQLKANSDKYFDNVIVIPAISEFENIKTLLKSLLQNDINYLQTTLIVFVVNNFASSDENIKNDNSQALEYLDRIINDDAVDDLSKLLTESNCNIGFIDAASAGKEFPENNGGVGLARKIGMDIALTVFDYASNNKKILICTDADCTFQNNYLSEIIDQFNKQNLSAAVINYEHDITGDDEYTKAIICYEYYLRYYVLGLKYANSLYAFHTIGSTIVCDHESYIKAEGMTKRKAAEDFYFLQKLAKATEVKKISTTTVYPPGRTSWRVPFGTGQRVSRFLSGERDEYTLYNPELFEILKQWSNILNKNYELVSDYLNEAKKIHPELYRFLIKQEFDRDFSRILNQAKGEKQMKLQKKQWFDGFRTLKLIHCLRDNHFPNINTFDAIDRLFEKMKISCNIKREDNSIPELPIQKQYLELLRKLDK